jgi:hypothetical protein
LKNLIFKLKKVPTKYGGLGFGCFESSTLSEILGYGCTGIAVALGGNGLAVYWTFFNSKFNFKSIKLIF